MVKGGCVYIMTNSYHTVLYTGVTAKLHIRIHEHITGKYPNSFTSKYNCTKLVYHKGYHAINEAIAEEKRIKSGSRQSKIDLINSFNPQWINLVESVNELRI